MAKVDSWHQVGAGGSDFVAQFSAADEFAELYGRGTLLQEDPAVFWEMAEAGRFDDLFELEDLMATKSNAAKMAEVQGKAVDRLLAKARRIVREVRVSEERGEERMSNLLDVAAKLGPLNASPEAVAEYWGLVEVAQSQLEGLCGSERVRHVEEGVEELV